MYWCMRHRRWYLYSFGIFSTIFLILWIFRHHSNQHLQMTMTSDVQINLNHGSAAIRQLQPRRSRPQSEPAFGGYGIPCEDNPLVEQFGTKCRIIAREFAGFGCHQNIVELAERLGLDITKMSLPSLNAKVADACPLTCGLCTYCAPECPTWFLHNGYCDQKCNNTECNHDGGDCWDSNCVTGDWSDWSECSLTCDRDGTGGVETRVRKIKKRSALKGKPCPELLETRVGCNKGVPCPSPCQTSEWSDWSPCDAECGVGQSSRSRQVVKPPENGADVCPELVQTRHCFIAECPRECEVSEWSEWSECSNDCGPGTRTRKRRILMTPVGYSECPPLLETGPCSGSLCSLTVSEICQVTPWASWTACSVNCGGGIQTRTRSYVFSEIDRDTKLKQFGSKCPMTEMTQENQCNTFKCPQDCVLSEWSEWSSCDAECGIGISVRTRKILTPAAGVGDPCPSEVTQQRECYRKPCDVDCRISEWGPWSSCVPLGECGFGLITRTRTIIEHPVGSGKSCPTLSESKECHLPCEIPCKLGSYSTWSDCTDECQTSGRVESGNFFQSRWKPINFISSTCPDPNSLIQTQSCGFDFTCPELSTTDCLVSEWSRWSECSATCGGGSRSRSRQVIREPGPGGRSCPPLFQAEQCGTFPCPIDCKLGDWSPWSKCSTECGLGTMIRSRNIIIQPNDHGSRCGPTEELSPCFGEKGVCERPCKVSEWQPWSDCSSTCGNYGLMKRMRKVLQTAIGDNVNCPELAEWESCNTHPCEPNCVVSEWSDWSPCSIDCGDTNKGTQIRNRQILKQPGAGGKECPDNLQESRLCVDTLPCPIDCELSEWSEWSECSSECGIGEMIRTREIHRKPDYGGALCGALKETADCYVKSCVVDCEVGDWGPWTPCSAECNGGTRSRKRDVLKYPANNGTACPVLLDIEECNSFVCLEYLGLNPNDCQVTEWSEWSECPVKCGGGVQTRTRDRSSFSHGGAPCPELVEKRGCGLSRCRDLPCEDNVHILSKSALTCAVLEKQGCDSNLYELSKRNGVPYPDDLPQEARVKDACPVTCAVCTECAPGCQLRDLGNAICDEECNNEACTYDLGDCGGECKLPSPIPAYLEIQPAATGLNVGQSVSIKCRSLSDRIEWAPELSEAIVKCVEPKAGREAVLKVYPETVFLNYISYPLNDLSTVFSCVPDTCPFVGIEGFSDEELLVFNGVYGRANSPDGRSHYLQDSRSPHLKKAKQSPFHLWMVSETALITHTQSAIKRNTISSVGSPDVSLYPMYSWRITPFDPYNPIEDGTRRMAAASGTGCHLPQAGQASNFTECLGNSSQWAIQWATESAEFDRVVKNISVRCIDEKEKKKFLKHVKNDTSTAVIQAIAEGGRPTTFLSLRSGENRKVFCQDQPEVPTIAKMSCEDIVEKLGCNFLLKETGKEIPDDLPENISVGQVCPETCGLCGEECAPGCPKWFLGNLWCDVACNNLECEFDNGDCRSLEQSQQTILPSQSIASISSFTETCQDYDEIQQTNYTCAMLKKAADDIGGCNVTIKEMAVSQNKKITVSHGVSDTIRILDICPKTCECCDCERQLTHDEMMEGKIEISESSADECIDDPMIRQFNYTCQVLRAVSIQKLNGCEAKLIEVAAVEGTDLKLPSGVPTITRVLDACPVTCECCHCKRFRRPKPGQAEKQPVVITLQENEIPNCIDDPRVQESTGMTCRQIAYAMNGDCSYTLSDLATTLPEGIPGDMKLSEACGYSCGKCPVCEDLPLVQQKSGFSCEQIAGLPDGCNLMLRSLTTLPEGTPNLTTLAHICPVTCGMCSGEKPTPPCQDHPRVEALGHKCDALKDFSSKGCNGTLLDMGVNITLLPPDLEPNAIIADACPATCETCTKQGHRCSDNSIVEKKNTSCATLKKVGVLGCESLLSDIQSDLLPDGFAAVLRVKDVCKASCGLCIVASCMDDFQNGDEEGIDCGGTKCRPCRSCSPAPLKALGPEYRIEGNGSHHMANRTITCSSQYERISGRDKDTIYCVDGSFSKVAIKCGEPRVEVIEGILRLVGGQYLDYTSLPSIYNALKRALRISSPSELKITSAGDCGEISTLSNFVCVDNPAVKEANLECSLLSRLGCKEVLADLSAQQGRPLPSGIPNEATVADACPLTCNACDAFSKRMQMFQESQSEGNDNSNEDITNCLRVDFMAKSTDNDRLLKSLTTDLNKEIDLSQLISTLENFFKADGVTIRYFVENEIVSTNAYEYMKSSHMKARLSEFKIATSPVSKWTSGFSSTGGLAIARSVFVAPGIPPPLFDSTAVTRGMHTDDIVGRMYRPVPGIGGSLPISALPSLLRSSEVKGGVVTGWVDSSASASVVTPQIKKISGECLAKSSDGCCDSRARFEDFLSSPCGHLIYNRVVSDLELHSFCFERNQQTWQNDVEEDEMISCYESAMRIVDSFKNKRGPICELIPYLEAIVDSWCSKDGIERLIDSKEANRRKIEKPFCFPTIKMTLQKRFDLFYFSSLSNQEMSSMCSPHSCTRHHLRYVDALTQLQAGWDLSGALPYNVTIVLSNTTYNVSRRDDSSVDANSEDSFSDDKPLPVPPIGGQPTRLLREESIKRFQEEVNSAEQVLDQLDSELRGISALSMRVLLPQEQRRKLTLRHLESKRLEEQSSTPSFGLYIAEYPEEFLEFVCTKINDSYCQETLLLLTNEDRVHNPAPVGNPCETDCFVPMTARLGGMVQLYGQRQNHPYYKTLGSILRSYGRFYCTRENEKKYCGDYLFNKMKPPRFMKNLNNDTMSWGSGMDKCRCSSSFINDGQCDLECFNEDCNWDGDDCRVPVMFPEAYYALIDIFSEAREGYPPEARLSMIADTSCLLYDPMFSCTPKCRRLYEASTNIQGCCFSAVLASLEDLLKIEMEHPEVAKSNRWKMDRSFSFLEQSCAVTFDRVCMGGDQRKIIKVDVVIENIDLEKMTKGSTTSGSIYGFTTETPTKIQLLMNAIRTKLTELLLLVDNDASSMNLRTTDNGIAIEVALDAGRESNRVEAMLNKQLLDRMSAILSRRLQAFPLESYSLITSLPNRIYISSPPNLRSRSIFTPISSFDTKASLPYIGSYGIGTDLTSQLSLPKEPCNSDDLAAFGSGYRVEADTARGHSFIHGATRTLKCAQGYTNTGGSDPDTLVCDNGRWIKENFLTCHRHCSPDVRTALSLKSSSNASAYIVGVESSESQHGAIRKISCGQGYTAGRGRSPTLSKCNDGTWTPITLECRRQCNSSPSLNPDAYIVSSGNTNSDHGAYREVYCARGYFPTPALSDMSKVMTECRDGQWTKLPVSCIKPETVDPSGGPGIFLRMAKQLFTGVGMIGIIFAIILALFSVTTVAFAWKLYFQHQAKQNTIDHEERMDHVAKLAALAQQSKTTTNTERTYSDISNWSADTERSFSTKHRGRCSKRHGEEDYFGDVELTPTSLSSKRVNYAQCDELMGSDTGSMTVKTLTSLEEDTVSIGSREPTDHQLNCNRRRSTLTFSRDALHRTVRGYEFEFINQSIPDQEILITMGDVSLDLSDSEPTFVPKRKRSSYIPNHPKSEQTQITAERLGQKKLPFSSEIPTPLNVDKQPWSCSNPASTARRGEVTTPPHKPKQEGDNEESDDRLKNTDRL